MDRCHLYLPLVDSSGATYTYAEVTLLDLDTGNPIDEPVYLTPTGGAPQEWPVLINPAVINLWTDNPLRVTVQALLPGGSTFTRSGVDITPAPAATVRSEHPVHIASADGLASEALLAVSPDGSATWQVLDALRFHNHEGDAPQATVLGPAVLNDIYPSQTWLGQGIGGSQGENSSALGSSGNVFGSDAVVLGRSGSGGRGVAAGAGADSFASSVALGAASNTDQLEQVALGHNTNAGPGPEGAVAIGSNVTAPAHNTVTVGTGAQVTDDGKVIVGIGTLPDLSWVNWSVAILGNAVMSRFFGARKDAVLASPVSTLGVFGSAGTTQPMVNTSSLSPTAPGRAALLSLVSALDQLGLIYLTDSAIDDELADWTASYAHDPNLVLESGDDGSKAGDLNRAKRNAAGPGWVTYQMGSSIRDFRVRVFAYQSSGPDPAALAAELVADVSPDNVTWTRVPLVWQPLTATAASWYQTWAANARAIPGSARYLRLTADVNSSVFTPQIGRVVVRRGSGILTGYGSSAYGSGRYGG